MSWFSFGRARNNDRKIREDVPFKKDNGKNIQKDIKFNWESISDPRLRFHLKDLWDKQYLLKVVRARNNLDHTHELSDIQKHFISIFDFSPWASHYRPPEEFRTKFVQIIDKLLECFCLDLNSNCSEPSESTVLQMDIFAAYIEDLKAVTCPHGKRLKANISTITRFYSIPIDEDLYIEEGT